MDSIENVADAARAGRMAGIPVCPRALRELQARTTSGKTWDRFLLELLEEYDPLRRWAEWETRRRADRGCSAGQLARIHEQLKLRGR